MREGKRRASELIWLKGSHKGMGEERSESEGEARKRDLNTKFKCPEFSHAQMFM